MRRPSLIASTVFQRVMLASALFIAASMAVLWALGAALLGEIDTAEWDAIYALEEEAQALAAEGGEAALVEIVRHEGDAIWPEDLLYERLEEEQPVFALRDAEDRLIAGYGGLWADVNAPGRVLLEHPEIDVALRAIEFELPGQLWGTIGRFEPEDEAYFRWVRRNATYAIILIALPLSLIIGYFLSRSVFGRIEAISATAEDVATGQMARRAPVTGAADEFDRLSGNINHMLDRLEQLNKNIEAVSVGVAHDLKTPLANVGGRLELIRRDLGDRDACEAHVEAAEGYLADLLRVFDALLRLGEVRAGRREAAFARFDLSDAVGEMAQVYAPLFEEAQKGLTVDVAPGVSALGDRELVDQLLSNLLENALEHSRDAAQVFVELVPHKGSALLRVGDDGPGVAPGDRARIFERFYRGDRSRGSKGNGLGLSLVRAIAELHGGSAAMDERAPGAVFEIRLPLG